MAKVKAAVVVLKQIGPFKEVLLLQIGEKWATYDDYKHPVDMCGTRNATDVNGFARRQRDYSMPLLLLREKKVPFGHKNGTLLLTEKWFVRRKRQKEGKKGLKIVRSDDFL